MGSVATDLRKSGSELGRIATGLEAKKQQSESEVAAQLAKLHEQVQAVSQKGEQQSAKIQAQQAAAEKLRQCLEKVQRGPEGLFVIDELNTIHEDAKAAATELVSEHGIEPQTIQSVMFSIRSACILHSFGKPLMQLQDAEVTQMSDSAKKVLASMETQIGAFIAVVRTASAAKATEAMGTLKRSLESGTVRIKLSALTAADFTADEVFAVSKGFEPASELFHTREAREALRKPDSFEKISESNPILGILKITSESVQEAALKATEIRSLLVDLKATPCGNSLSFPVIERAADDQAYAALVEKYPSLADSKSEIIGSAKALTMLSLMLEKETQTLESLNTALDSIPKWKIIPREKKKAEIEKVQDRIHDLVFDRIPELRADLLKTLSKPLAELDDYVGAVKAQKAAPYAANETEICAIMGRVLADSIDDGLDLNAKRGKSTQFELVSKAEVIRNLQAAADVAALISLGKEESELKLDEKISKNERQFNAVASAYSAIVSASANTESKVHDNLRNYPNLMRRVVAGLEIAAAESAHASVVLQKLEDRLDERKSKKLSIPVSEIEGELLDSLKKLVEENASLSFAKQNTAIFHRFLQSAEDNLTALTGTKIVMEKPGQTAALAEALRNLSDWNFEDFAASLNGEQAKLLEGDRLFNIEIAPKWSDARPGVFEIALNKAPEEDANGYAEFKDLEDIMPSIELAKSKGFDRHLKISPGRPLVIPILVPKGEELDSEILKRFAAAYCQRLTAACEAVIEKCPAHVTIPTEFKGFSFEITASIQSNTTKPPAPAALQATA